MIIPSAAQQSGLALILLLLTVSSATASESYTALQAKLTRGEHRLPGSDNFAAAAAAVEESLTRDGLTVNRQTFNALVPDGTCSLTLGGKPIEGVLALGPNAFANNTTAGKTITGPVVWLSDGSLASMNGKPVAGSIALLRFDSPNMDLVFSQGARAVVFVGSGTETQWQLRHQFADMPMILPRLFIPEADARRQGLLSEQASAGTGSLSITTTWKDVIATNLWTLIPGDEGNKETVILAATLDTFGTVPQRCPGSRSAANAALLATVAGQLKKASLKRDVLVVFFGSHYAAQDGARNFYYAVTKAGDASMDSLANRFAGYESSLKTIEEQCRLLEGDLLGSDHPLRTKTLQLLRQKLNAWVANANYHLQDLGIKARVKSSTLDEAAIAALEKTIAEVKAKKKVWNGLRSQISKGKITDEENYQALVTLIANDLKARRSDFTNRRAHNQTFQRLAEAVKGKRIAGHFGFDFSDSSAEWLFNPLGAPENPYYHSLRASMLPTLAPFQRHIRGIAALTTTDGPKAFVENLQNQLSPDAFCMPGRRSTAAVIPNSLQLPGYQLISIGADLGRDETPYAETVDLSGLVPSMAEFCSSLANEEAVSAKVGLKKYSKSDKVTFYYQGESIYGTQFTNYALGGSELEGPTRNGIAGAVVNGMSMADVVIAGHSRVALTRINKSGYTFMPIIYGNPPVQSYGYDETGAFNRFPVDAWQGYRSFYGHGGATFLPLLPTSYNPFNGKVLNGFSDSSFKTSFVMGNQKSLMFYNDRETAIK
ncbi:MAG: hypothetical protein ACYTGH_08055, partial [Planctomycetota bacterium]